MNWTHQDLNPQGSPDSAPKLFSVIIPTYNRAAVLREAIASVLDQEWQDFEVLVVDDGSSDETVMMGGTYAGRVKFMSQQNQGPGAARNLGVSRAQGRYLAFLDSDDLLFPWSLKIYAEVIQSFREPAFIAGKPRIFKSVEELWNLRPGALSTNAFSDYLNSGNEWRWWGASSFVIRRDQFLAAGGFAKEPINGEDADLALKLGIAPGFVQITQPETFAYRQHGSNVMKNTARNVSGACYQVKQELAGVYPGQKQRARERWRIITRHVRSATREGLQAGLAGDAWRLYRDTLRWNLTLGHWKYLFGFPLLAASTPSRSSGLKLRAVGERNG
jgi:glycosyltransferase involved in cell wall biosynthesis